MTPKGSLYKGSAAAQHLAQRPPRSAARPYRFPKAEFESATDSAPLVPAGDPLAPSRTSFDDNGEGPHYRCSPGHWKGALCISLDAL